MDGDEVMVDIYESVQDELRMKSKQLLKERQKVSIELYWVCIVCLIFTPIGCCDKPGNMFCDGNIISYDAVFLRSLEILICNCRAYYVWYRFDLTQSCNKISDPTVADEVPN